MYYPKSQIQTNLYTNGTEFVLSTTEEAYKGFYYQLSNGKKFTGKTPDDGASIPLLPPPINDSTDSQEQDSTSTYQPIITPFPINNITPTIIERFIPRPNLTIPTQKDYNLGEYQRYFAKKNNENIYLEISKETCDELKNQSSNIAWYLYTAISLSWELSGDQDQTYLINKNIVTLIEDRENWYGFTQWFKDDFAKYYKPLGIKEDLFTDGTEFINRRTKLAYKGPYHIHPEKGAMIGKTHSDQPHGYLIPIETISSY